MQGITRDRTSRWLQSCGVDHETGTGVRSRISNRGGLRGRCRTSGSDREFRVRHQPECVWAGNSRSDPELGVNCGDDLADNGDSRFLFAPLGARRKVRLGRGQHLLGYIQVWWRVVDGGRQCVPGRRGGIVASEVTATGFTAGLVQGPCLNSMVDGWGQISILECGGPMRRLEFEICRGSPKCQNPRWSFEI